MVFDSNIDAAMDDIKKGMVLLRCNSDTDSLLFWEALLEVNKALAIEDTERALRYLKKLLEAPLSSRLEFRHVFVHIADAYGRITQRGRNLEDIQAIVKAVEQKYGITLNS